MKVFFLGDISLNNKYNILYSEGKKPFEEVFGILNNSDLVIGNLECLAKSEQGENLLKKPRLHTNLKTLNYLKQINLNLALLANNHVYDNLEDGFRKTVQFLKENGIDYIGAGFSKEEAQKPFITKIDDQTIYVLNYITEDTNPRLPDNAGVYLNWFNKNKIIEEIRKYRKHCDQVFLCLHWGGKVERGYYPDWEQPSIARELIEAGADLIVGHHSHTLQPYEKYKGKYIFYSLGNFCFADIHCDGKINEIERGRNTESIILEINFKKPCNEVNIIPIENKDMYIVENQEILRKLTKRNKTFESVCKYKLFWHAYFFKYKYINPVIFFLWGNDHNFIQQINKLSFGKILRFIRK
jgi:hypothetical protein